MIALDFIIGIILLVSFIGFIVYAYKGYNLMIGFVLMSILWVSLPVLFSQGSLSLNDALQTVFQTAPEKWGAVLVNIFFGSFFGRILLDTGIAKNIITKSIELAGDNQYLILVFVNLITLVIFSSMSGAGAVIAIGVIILPILLSIGIPKDVALLSFTGTVAAGIFANPVNFSQYQVFFNDIAYSFSDYAPFGYLASFIMVTLVSLTSCLYLKLRKGRMMWSVSYYEKNHDIPGIALITPFIPVVGVALFKIPVIICFIVAALFAMIICKLPKQFDLDFSQTVSKLFKDAVVDTAPMVGFWMALSMFNASAHYVGPYFNVVIGPLIPTSALGLCIFFSVFSVLTWFRGPMSLIGSGAALLAIIMHSTTVYPTSFLYPLFISIMIGMGHFDVTTSWVTWGLSYMKLEAKDYMKIALVPGVIIAIVLEAVTYFWFGGF